MHCVLFLHKHSDTVSFNSLLRLLNLFRQVIVLLTFFKLNAANVLQLISFCDLTYKQSYFSVKWYGL